MLGHAFADAGQLRELLCVFGKLGNGVGKALDQLGSFLVAAVAAGLRTIDLEQMRGLAQGAGHFTVFRGVNYRTEPAISTDADRSESVESSCGVWSETPGQSGF